MGGRFAGKDPAHLVDRVDPADGGQDRVEVAGVRQLEVEVQRGHPVSGGVRRAGDDVDVVVGQHLGHVAQQLGPVERLDLDGDDPAARALPVPLRVDQAGALAGEAGGVGAVGPVDGDAPAAGDEADDLVAG